MARVDELRRLTADSPNLASALHAIKSWQSKRFAQTYQDLLESEDYAGCARFFLEELYSERNYSHRDAQFAKVAGAIELTFPENVIAVAVSLAELHATTERLDHAMASCWNHTNNASPSERYLDAWKSVGEPAIRHWQLQTVLHIGQTLAELTQKRGLRLLLKMMRRPAEMAGLGDLQTFLETGFERFGRLTKTDGQATHFLTTIREREMTWLNEQFGATNAGHKAKNAQSDDWAFRALGA
ncbi:hypothetical protein RA876_03930 [Rhodoferax antarcticus]|nr:hypothetical protein RA876_03930 [Rhodoferax antarcticus]